jgi:hypothetical protein|tara:strand:- start:2048 stop:2503 length:456 start_codon:yes stop_codon:yes gene_type:complete
MMSVAALVDNLGPSQMSFYLIKRFNNLIKSVNYAPVCFYNNLTRPVITPFFACMNIACLSTFNGVVLATSLETANTALQTCGKMDKYLYLWDLEWLRKPLDFDNVASVLRHPDLNIIARSEEHKRVIENYTNRKICGVVDDWKIEDILGII